MSWDGSDDVFQSKVFMTEGRLSSGNGKVLKTFFEAVKCPHSCFDRTCEIF